VNRSIPDFKTVVLRIPVNEWLDPKKEAPSLEGASLVSATPPIGKPTGVGYAHRTLEGGHQGFFGDTELSLEFWLR